MTFVVLEKNVVGAVVDSAKPLPAGENNNSAKLLVQPSA